MLTNRLKKNLKKLRSYLSQASVSAYRLYDRDMPEAPYIVDIYADWAVIYEKGIKNLEREELRQANQREIVTFLQTELQLSRDQIIFKERKIKEGKKQYTSHSHTFSKFTVTEGPRKYLIDPINYLDTGLFIDHRPIRDFFQKNAPQRLLNLFCYTSSVSLAAALGGSQTTNIDLSQTYLNWSLENFKVNKMNLAQHQFIKAHVLDFLANAKAEKYPTIFVDPPSFSNSKSMEESFDVSRDHSQLLRLCRRWLEENGALYFSTNLRKFKLDEQLHSEFSVQDLTEWSLPKDCHDKKTHRLFCLRPLKR